MDYITISNKPDRIIRFGLSIPERYLKSDTCEYDPWWNVYVYVKKDGILFEANEESMTKYELLDLVHLIEKSRTFQIGKEERTDFMEPDYDLIISKLYGSFIIHVKYADSLHLWLEREDLDKLAQYIKEKLKRNDNEF